MKVDFALLCDAANASREGKLNILGEFNGLWFPKLPVQWPRMVLVLRCTAHVSEGTDHKLTLKLLDEDGGQVLPPIENLPFKFVAIGSGLPLRGQLMAQLDGIPFRKYGTYSLAILIDGRHEADVPMFVRQTPKAGQQPAGK